MAQNSEQAYGDFSDIKSSICYSIDDFEISFIAIFLFSKNAETSRGGAVS